MKHSKSIMIAFIIATLVMSLFQVGLAATRRVTLWAYPVNEEFFHRKAEIESKFHITLDIKYVAEQVFPLKLRNSA